MLIGIYVPCSLADQCVSNNGHRCCYSHKLAILPFGSELDGPLRGQQCKTELSDGMLVLASTLYTCKHIQTCVCTISILRTFRKWLPRVHNRMTKEKKKDFARGAGRVVKRGAKPSRGPAAVCLVCSSRIINEFGL